MKLKDHLLGLGFEQRLPWQFHNDHYQITQLEEDSHGYELWSIISKRYDSTSFRGRIRNTSEFDVIFALVKEDYTLTDEEIGKLKIVG